MIMYIKKEVCGLPVLGSINDLEKGIENYKNIEVIVGIGDNNTGIKYFTAIHPRVIIGNRVNIGEGTVIVGGAVINIGTEAVVTKDIPPNCTAVGVPAKPIKFH